MMPIKYLWITGLLATLGAIVTGLGEWLMLYSPNMGYGAGAGHMNLLYPSVEQLKIGFYLGVLGAPMYVLGYWHVSKMLKLSTFWSWMMIGLATVGFMIGNVWLGTNAYLALIVQASFNAGGETAGLMQLLIFQIEQLSTPLLNIVRGIVFYLSLIIVISIIRKDTYYPLYFVLLVPFVLIIDVFIFFFMAPTLGNYFLPAALNVAHAIFFAVSTFKASRLR